MKISYPMPWLYAPVTMGQNFLEGYLGARELKRKEAKDKQEMELKQAALKKIDIEAEAKERHDMIQLLGWALKENPAMAAQLMANDYYQTKIPALKGFKPSQVQEPSFMQKLGQLNGVLGQLGMSVPPEIALGLAINSVFGDAGGKMSDYIKYFGDQAAAAAAGKSGKGGRGGGAGDRGKFFITTDADGNPQISFFPLQKGQSVQNITTRNAPGLTQQDVQEDKQFSDAYNKATTDAARKAIASQYESTVGARRRQQGKPSLMPGTVPMPTTEGGFFGWGGKEVIKQQPSMVTRPPRVPQMPGLPVQMPGQQPLAPRKKAQQSQAPTEADPGDWQ